MKKTSRIIDIAFGVISAAFGILLIVYGIHSAGVDTTVPTDERCLDTMWLTIPGILLLLDTAVYILRSRMFRSYAAFILLNFLLFVLVGFIAEVVYFQFIYFGFGKPQYKLMIPAILIVVVYGVAVMIVSSLCTLTHKIAEKS